MKEFKGRVAVVTGAASGIGRGMAETFAAAGMKVVLSDIEKPALEEPTGALRVAGADVRAALTDVSKPDQVDDAARRAGRAYSARSHSEHATARAGRSSTSEWIIRNPRLISLTNHGAWRAGMQRRCLG
jgi:NAD(P)-dependent dehydrogenase (short-subunit alcohol dehydrogenase family)